MKINQSLFAKNINVSYGIIDLNGLVMSFSGNGLLEIMRCSSGSV